MLGLLNQDHREERGACGEILEVARAKHFHRRREGMPYHREWSVRCTKAEADEREEGILFVAAVDRSPAAGALVESRPHLECLAADCHVAAGSYSAESTDVEP